MWRPEVAITSLESDADIEKAFPGRVLTETGPAVGLVRGSQSRKVLSQPALATKFKLGSHSMQRTGASWLPTTDSSCCVSMEKYFTALSRPPLYTDVASVSNTASKTGAPCVRRARLAPELLPS